MESQKLKVKVRILNSDILEYEVSSSDTLQSLRTKLKEVLGIDEKDQFLGGFERLYQTSMDRSFFPDCTFEEYAVKDGDTLQLNLRKGGFRLFVKTIKRQILELDADAHDPIWNIKGLIQEQTGYPVQKQIVLCGGYELKDHHLLSDYAVSRDSTFHLILKS